MCCYDRTDLAIALQRLGTATRDDAMRTAALDIAYLAEQRVVSGCSGVPTVEWSEADLTSSPWFKEEVSSRAGSTTLPDQTQIIAGSVGFLALMGLAAVGFRRSGRTSRASRAPLAVEVTHTRGARGRVDPLRVDIDRFTRNSLLEKPRPPPRTPTSAPRVCVVDAVADESSSPPPRCSSDAEGGGALPTRVVSRREILEKAMSTELAVVFDAFTASGAGTRSNSGVSEDSRLQL